METLPLDTNPSGQLHSLLIIQRLVFHELAHCVSQSPDIGGCNHDYDFWQDKDSIEEAFWQVHLNAPHYWSNVLCLADVLVAAANAKPRDVLYRKVAEEEDEEVGAEGDGVAGEGEEEDGEEKVDEELTKSAEHDHEAQHGDARDKRTRSSGPAQNKRRLAKRQEHGAV